MGFLAELIQTVIKMFFIAAVSFGGIQFGKHLRASKTGFLACSSVVSNRTILGGKR